MSGSDSGSDSGSGAHLECETTSPGSPTTLTGASVVNKRVNRAHTPYIFGPCSSQRLSSSIPPHPPHHPDLLQPHTHTLHSALHLHRPSTFITPLCTSPPPERRVEKRSHALFLTFFRPKEARDPFLSSFRHVERHSRSRPLALKGRQSGL